MTPDELKEALTAAGWRFGRKMFGLDHGEQCDWYAWMPQKMLPSHWPNCECNDKPPTLTITPNFFRINGHEGSSVDFEICGELHGEWHKLQIYNIKAADAMANIPKALALLGSAWCAIAEAKE